MKKKILLLVTFSVIAIVSILFLIPMINYVITYEDWYSFMTLNGAIVTVICLFVALIGTITGIVLVALKMKRSRLNKENIL